MKRVMMVALAAVAALPAAAEERRELGAHEHGHSVLNVAIEGERVAMELIAPGADIVGFEHPAETQEDKAAVAQAQALLEDPLALFVLPAAAGCSLESAAVALESEDEHEEHAEDHDADDEDHAGHTEFHVEYAIRCASPDHLGGIAFAFFEHFPGSMEIDVTVISDSGQTRYEVERDVPRIDLVGVI